MVEVEESLAQVAQRVCYVDKDGVTHPAMVIHVGPAGWVALQVYSTKAWIDIVGHAKLMVPQSQHWDVSVICQHSPTPKRDCWTVQPIVAA
jgi:hypothetical protein